VSARCPRGVRQPHRFAPILTEPHRSRKGHRGRRSFLFAFLGIEALASSLRNDVLPTAISRLQAELEDELPINDLIWPQPAGIDERPDRSALFQFAVLATALSPATAASDVDTFRQLQKDRHRLAHPKDHALDSFPFSEGQHLLRRYITLVANHTW